jgi:hypothetical protein
VESLELVNADKDVAYFYEQGRVFAAPSVRELHDLVRAFPASVDEALAERRTFFAVGSVAANPITDL